MSNPTSNFGWQMPTATDLVTDLPADFEVFGQAVDTTLVDLKGGTTGQILAKNTNTDMDFIWTTPNPGDITAVTAGTGITGGGTSGAVTITNDMATTITASGDIVIGTGSGTYDNLPIGTTGQLLTADTTVSPYKVKWATPASSGGMTVIASGSMSSTSLLISSIPSTYVDLVLEMDSFYHNVANWGWSLRLNDDNTASSYYNATAFDTVSGTAFNASQIQITFDNGGVQSNSKAKVRVLIPSYAVSTSWKMVQAYGLTQVNATPANFYFQANAGLYNQTTAISSMRIVPNTGATIAGDYTLYGVK